MQDETLRQDDMIHWRGEPVEADAGGGMRRYVDAVRDHWLTVVAILFIAVAAGGVYLATASKVYSAEASLLITPAPTDDPTALFTPGIVRASSNPVQAAQTTADLVVSSAVTEKARTMLHDSAGVGAAVASATAAPVGESNVVAVTTQSDHPRVAQAAANAVAQATIDVRTEQLHAQLDRAIAALTPQVAAAKRSSTGSGSLADTLVRLRALRAGSDPTVSLQSLAPVPATATSPRSALTLVVAVLIGAILGLAGALVRQSLDPRLRREEQLRNLYGAPPVLARIPLASPGRGRQRLAADSYRALVTSLAARLVDRHGPRTVVVTGSSRGDGVTTTAMQLGRAIAAGGSRVIVVVTDRVSEASNKATHPGLWSVLVGAVSVSDALLRAPGAEQNLRLLLASDAHAGEWGQEGITNRAVRELISTLKNEADWIIVDAQPLNEVANALPFALEADAVLMVARMGRTHLPDITETLDIVQRHRLPLTGCALVGVPRRGRAGEHRSRRVDDDLEAMFDAPIAATTD